MSVRQPLAIFFCMMMAMALVWSKALLAISSGFLVFIAATDIYVQPFRIRWMLRPSLVLGTITYKPFIWVFSLFGLWYIISIVYAGNLSEWWALTHMKLDFILIPMSIAMLRPFTKKEYMLVVLSMVILAVWSSIWVQVYFFQDHDLWTRSLGFGGSLPTPTHHIRYSIIIAMSMVICLYFAIENFQLRYPFERSLYGVLAIYFFYFLHILSVRSGLALGYAGLLILAAFYIRKLQLWKKLVLAALIILTPVVSYMVLPGFKQKINYTLYDFGQYMKGEGGSYSDSERLYSLQAGIAIGREHWLIGTGTGKFRSAIRDYYQNVLHKTDNVFRPENQFINVFALFGVVGLLLFCFVIFFPMMFKGFWRPPLMPTLYIMQLLSLLVEHALDTAVGTSMFLLITCIGLSYQDSLEKWGAGATSD